MKNLLTILVLVISVTACATQSPAPVSPIPASQGSQALATATRPRESSVTQTPQASGGRNQVTRTPQDNRGGDATQNLSLDVPAHPIDIILGRPTQRSITASVLAYQDSEGYIEFGTQVGVHPNKTPMRSFAKGQPVEILIDALSPNTQYYYQVFYRAGNSGGFTLLEEKSFRTQRVPNSTFTFDIQADSHLDSNSSLDVYARTLANERADQPDFLIDLGDTFMTGKYQPYTAALPQYLAQRYYLSLIGRSSPLFLVLGNHDGEDAQRGTLSAANDIQVWSAKLRTQYFPNPMPNDFYTGNPTPDKNVGALQDYYAWEWGDALFIVLDPYWFTPPQRGTTDNWNRTLGDAQYQWLKKTLETSHAKWKFVFIHQLVGGLDKDGRGGVEVAKYFEWGGYNLDGSYGFMAERPDWAMPIHQLLVQNKADIVFHGHDHLFVKQDLEGIVYQEVPQPSAARFGATNSAKEYSYVNGDVLSSSGHLRVTVSPLNVKVEYVRAYLPKDENAQRKNGQVDYTYIIPAH